MRSIAAGLTNLNSVTAICEKYSPDVVIHCAGIAHQKIGAVDSATYMRVNSEATENLANAAARDNPMIEIPYPFQPKALLGKKSNHLFTRFGSRHFWVNYFPLHQ